MTAPQFTASRLTAIAIILGVALVTVAVYISNTRALAEDMVTIQRAEASERRLYGNDRAPVVIVEFSDYECPYCASLHPTLKKIVDESAGQVAWEYRHLPLDFHPLAKPAALTAECVAEIKGNEAFWNFTERLFAEQRSLTENRIVELATEFGITANEQAACLSNPALSDLLQSDIAAATLLGGSGTPYSVIVFPDNTYRTVSGAIPYDQWLTIIKPYVE